MPSRSHCGCASMSIIDPQPKQPSDEMTGADSANRAFDATRNTEKPLWFRLAWLPIPLLLVIMAVFADAKLGDIHDSFYLRLALNFVFLTLVFLFVAYLVGRSFLSRSTPGLLLLGCGVLIWGVGAAASIVLGRRDVNVAVTIFNLGACLAALCHLAGVSLSIRPRRALHPAGVWLASGYVGALLVLGLISILAIDGRVPIFFVEGQGSTTVRHLVLGSAVAMFALAAILLWTTNRKSLSPFAYWYSYALALFAVGLFGTLFPSSFSSVLFWTARSTQWLGGVYMLIAAIASVRESHGWGISLEAALHESEERFRLLVEGAKDHAIFMLDPDGRVVSWNSGAEAMRGYTAPEIIGHHWSCFYVPEDVERGKPEWLLKTAAERGAVLDEGWRVRKDGSRFWAEVALSALRDDSGRIRGFSNVTRDITERKRAEEETQKSKHLLEMFVEYAPAGLAMFDRNMRYVRVSKKWHDETGLDDSAIRGKSHYEVFPNLSEHWKEAHRRGLGGESLSDEEDWVAADGTQRTIRWAIHPWGDSGTETGGIIIFSEDITERRKAEQRIAHLASFPELNASPILEIDPQGKITYANPAARMRFPDIAEIGAKHPMLKEWSAVTAALGTDVQQQVLIREVEADGTVFQQTVHNLPDIGLVRVYIADITERKRAEEERETTVEFLRLVNLSRGTRDLIQTATTFFQQRSACEAVGIRLQEGNDYPYFEYRGFSKEFVQAENLLCKPDESGLATLDSAGHPVLDCMCGNVIRGRFDPAKPFFTANGSFWANDTTSLLATTTDTDRQARTRNRCNGEGYESVALIALRIGEQRLGLLQLNDRQKGRFSIETILLWERLADYLAVALSKFRAEEALQQSEEQLQKLNRTLNALNNCNQALLHATDEPTLLQQVCRIVSEDCGHAMVWIGFAENDGNKTVRPVASAGFEEGYLETMRITWADSERGRGPTGTAIRTGQPSICRNMLTDPAYLPWREEAIKRGYACSLVVPLKEDDKTFGAITIYSREPDTFSEGEIDLLTELAADLAYGIGTLRVRAARAQAEEALREQAELLDLAHDTIMVRDLDGTIRFWNRGAEGMYGYSKKQATGRISHALLWTVFPKPLAEIEADLLREGRWEGELIHNTQDGKSIVVASRWVLQRDKNGQAYGVMEIDNDITERKRAEHQSAASLDAMTRLQKLGTMFVREGNLGSVLGEIVEAAMAISAADFGNIQLLDAETATLRIVAQRGFPQWWIDFWTNVSRGHGVCGTALERGERVIIEDVEQSPIFVGTPALEIQLKAGVRAVQSTPLVSRSGKPLGMFSTHYKMPHRPDERALQLLDLLARQASDIIERTQAEAAVLESERRFRAFFETEAVGTTELDLYGRFMQVNQHFCQISGYSREELLGMGPADLTHPEDRDRDHEQLASFQRGDSPIYDTEKRYVRKDGSVIWVQVRASMIRDAEGKFLRSAGVVQDITERKRAQEALRASEERWSTTLRSVGDAVISTCAQGKIIFMNEVAENLTGWPLAEAQGRDLDEVFNIVNEMTRIKPENPVAKVIRMGQVVGLANHTALISRSGTELPIEDSGAPIRDKEGQVTGVVLVFHDISEKRRAEKALRDSERLAMTGRMASTLAHEIHNPLDTVGGLLFLINQTPDAPEPVRQQASLAGEELARVTQMTRHMLSFQREAKNPVPIKIGEVLDNVIALFERKIESAGIQVEKRVDFEGEFIGLPGEMRQVFANLIGNAIKAIGKNGKIRLHAYAGHDWHRGRLGLRVTVADNGPGIPDEVHDKIFDPFFTTKGEGGTGLGLWITSGIVKNSDGMLRLRTSTRVGRSGTCFSIFFPLPA